MHRDVLQHDVAEGRGILYRHVHEEVVFTGDMEHLDDAGNPHERIEELADSPARVPPEPYADHTLQGQAENSGVEHDAHALDHTSRTQGPQAVCARRFRNAQGVGERLVRASRLLDMRGQQPQVEIVEPAGNGLLIGQVTGSLIGLRCRFCNEHARITAPSARSVDMIGGVRNADDMTASARTRITGRFETVAVHGGREDFESLGVHAPPLDLSSTYPLPGVEIGGDSYEALATGGQPIEGGSHVYARLWNPTVARFEDALAQLEGAEAAVAFSSGMAAVTAALMAHTTSKGKPHVVAVRPLYGGTDHLLATGMLGTEVTYCEVEEIGGSVRPDTGLVIVETPANPTLELVDISRVVAQAGDVPVLVDNTFATPVLQNPLAHGAAMSLHSATKYLGGHGDVIGGVIACSEQTAEALRPVRALTGAILHPLAAYLLHRGLPTLPLRVRAQQDAAARIAQWLADHPAVSEVFYPGLTGDPLVGTQMRGGGAMIAIRLRGGYDAAARAASATTLFCHAVSLGGVDSLIQHPAALTHRPVAPEARPGADILRLSVGLEHVDDLIADLAEALASIPERTTAAAASITTERQPAAAR